MRTRCTAIFFFIIAAPFCSLKAQEWKIISFNLGYRIFEVKAVGNNPTTIVPLLKDPGAYQTYLSSITYNSLYGNPEILQQRTLYVNTEWQKDSTLSGFWKKYTIHTGLLLTTRISRKLVQLEMKTIFLHPIL